MSSSSLNGSSMFAGPASGRAKTLTHRCRSKEKFYLIFELAAGGELYEHLMAEGRLGEEEAREVAHSLVVRRIFIYSKL